MKRKLEYLKTRSGMIIFNQKKSYEIRFQLSHTHLKFLFQSQRYIPPPKADKKSESNPKSNKEAKFDTTKTNLDETDSNDLSLDKTRSPSQNQLAKSPNINLPRYRSESNRLQTFKSWKKLKPKPCDLAQAGFVYVGNTLVICFFDLSNCISLP